MTTPARDAGLHAATPLDDHRTGVAHDSAARRWAARILFIVPVLFLLMDGVMKLVLPTVVVDTSAQLGISRGTLPTIGIILLASLALYVVPRTAVLGAVLLTGYLGGAVATHLRVGSPLIGATLFPVYVGVMIWGALWLREARLRALFPMRVS